MVTKFSPEGKVLMVLGRRPPAVAGVVAYPAGPNQPAEKYIFCRPTDVGWDPQGNIFVSDGYCNNRVVKYDKNGRFLAQVGSEKAGKEPGRSSICRTALQVDGQGNVWVADRANNRYAGARQQPEAHQGDLRQHRRLLDGVHFAGSAPVRCSLSNSNPNGNAPGTWDITGEIYKMELDGTMLGKFGHAGK